jgi:thiol-disulfide isomerase/thioredoxin
MHGNIISLKSSDFFIHNGKVHIKRMNSPGMLLIWSNSCPHCHTFIDNIYIELSKQIGSNFKCTAIENSELKNQGLSQALDFEYFPTLKFFDQHGKIIGGYPKNKSRSKSDILSYICEVYNHCVSYH